ncbi:MAG: hypothetical protein A2Y98_03165 [Candidatus Portnoybacteria bacterium RBG_19FT_COMBO_36_7]|uniref:Uncharacterized protein n=1 Tax=Candidatus Portnoybacteria bacterium RBG_19FT_COMBO_36_7 TaxID=1801992 RepID=A0A1G2F9T6_9BACT|nr:MAG: hypothetical protein A2Y98_03165 [Candidatus Portnoybacteria bacterium RBG_19FT_COMBO_36_7]
MSMENQFEKSKSFEFQESELQKVEEIIDDLNNKAESLPEYSEEEIKQAVETAAKIKSFKPLIEEKLTGQI